MIRESGISPIDAVNKMLDKQWSTVELKFFEKNIAYNRSKDNPFKENKSDMHTRVCESYFNPGITFEHGIVL